jgi:non-specific protein-tyrosine kinase
MSKLRKALDRARQERGELSRDAVLATDDSANTAAVPPPETGTPPTTKPGAKAAVPGDAQSAPEVTAAAKPTTAGTSTPGTATPGTAKQTRVCAVSAAVLRRHRVIVSCADSPFADTVKVLRTRIIATLERFSGNSLLITSPREHEGKTLTAVNLAISIAQEINRTTLLVDADLRHPSVATYFGFTEAPGLADYLLGKAELPELLINPSIPKLTILPGGRPLASSSEMLGAEQTKRHFTEMKERYADRFLVFDSPALLSGADALVLSEYVDGIVLVVEAERTPAAALTRALELLKDKPVIGTVFNKAR